VAYLFATHCQEGRLSDKGQAQHRLPALLLAVKRPHVLNAIHLNDGLFVESNAIADNAQGAVLQIGWGRGGERKAGERREVKEQPADGLV
jgi:hypothetical protein